MPQFTWTYLFKYLRACYRGISRFYRHTHCILQCTSLTSSWFHHSAIYTSTTGTHTRGSSTNTNTNTQPSYSVCTHLHTAHTHTHTHKHTHTYTHTHPSNNVSLLPEHNDFRCPQSWLSLLAEICLAVLKIGCRTTMARCDSLWPNSIPLLLSLRPFFGTCKPLSRWSARRSRTSVSYVIRAADVENAQLLRSLTAPDRRI